MALITTTERKEFKPLGRRMDYAWDVLREVLGRELGPAYAALLAEPLSSAQSGTTDWHTVAGGRPLKMTELGPDEARALSDRLYEVRLQVHKLADRIETKSSKQQSQDKSLADALRRAVIVPDDNKFVYALNDQPVLVEWSHVYIDDNRPETTIFVDVIRKPRIEAAAETVPEAAAETPTTTPVVIQTPEKAPRRLPWALLWLLFAAIMSAIFYLLLQACGISTFGLNMNFGRFTQACVAAAPSGDYEAELARRADLLRRIRQAELDLARDQGDCNPPVPVPPQRVEAPPPPEKAVPPDGGPSIKDRLDREKAQTGELQISLAWNGLEDLDLHVDCPGGTIYFGADTACGGKLDIDMNAGKKAREAVENVFWSTPPNGTYTVKVKFFDRNDEAARTVPFAVRVKRGNKVETFTGSAPKPGEIHTVTTFTIP